MNLPDGVYFGVPEDDYHKIPRFSCSGVKNMMVSELDFWTESWLNPEKAEEREDGEDKEDTMFKMKGRAYHCRLLEGRAVFNARYAFSVDPAAFKGLTLLITAKDMERELKKIGAVGLSKLDKAGLIARTLEEIPGALIWDRLEAQNRDRHAGKTILPYQWRREMEFGAAMIEMHPHLKHAFTGGYAEVTMLWTKVVEDSDGSGRTYKIPMKNKFDYLKPEAIVDYKTFGNQRKKKIRHAVTSAMAEQKNHIQVAIYYEAADELVKALTEGRYWWGTDTAASITADEVKALANPNKVFFFVFQKTGKAPVAVGRTMPRLMNVVDVGRLEYEAAALQFAKAMAVYGADPWLVPDSIEEFEDTQFPVWMTE